MGFEVGLFADEGLKSEFLEWLVSQRWPDIQRHFGRMWDYYSNPMSPANAADNASTAGKWYIQAQEMGLPARITAAKYKNGSWDEGAESVTDIQRKEVVIENDIAWRINSAVDFLFGKPVSFISKSPDESKRAEITSILKALFESNGGVGFFQDMAVLGSVYGFVDCLVRPGERFFKPITSTSPNAAHFAKVLEAVKAIDLELIDAGRALPVLDEFDYKTIRYYVLHFYVKKNDVSNGDNFISRFLSSTSKNSDNRKIAAVTEIISDNAWQRYEDGQLTGQGETAYGFLPIVHIQNIAQPFYYEGISDVEQLIPLQDELNTRLSDRAYRITFQAFKMYLGKGVEGFEKMPVAPGMMWCTDNPNASIEEFGGDANTPSENAHIDEIREAMDKLSSVTPLAAGIIKGKIGNLTSAVALKMTLMGMLSKTERKKFTYGEGIKKIAAMVLAMLDKAGIYQTSEEDRDIEVIFPNPLPEDMTEKLAQAQIKKELGVSNEKIMKELGY